MIFWSIQEPYDFIGNGRRRYATSTLFFRKPREERLEWNLQQVYAKEIKGFKDTEELDEMLEEYYLDFTVQIVAYCVEDQIFRTVYSTQSLQCRTRFDRFFILRLPEE